MQQINLTNQTTHKKSIANDYHVIHNQRQNVASEPSERHFTKTINGEPGINPPARTFYPRSYSADGPGGSYPGL